jgi:hypothetical protein
MFYVLNAIAMLMNHNFGQAVMLVMTMSCVGYYALRMSYAGSTGYKVHLGKVIGMVAMIYFMLLPRADMMIYDHVSKKREKVDNLPLGFALPVGMLEGFGDLLTGGFEQAFNMNNTNYRDYGMVFGARLVQESRNWRIRSPEFLENMSNFIDRCVMLDAMIGYHYTPEELLTTDDIWGLVKANASTLRQTSVRIGKTRSLMSCKEAADKVIEPAFRLEIESLEKKSRGSDIAEAGHTTYVLRTFERLNSNFKKNIELSFKSYVGSNAGAENLIRQQMMMNAIKNYSDDYGYARASATQESNWRIAGDLAGTYLPILMSVLKGLVYSSFIFMFPMLIMSGGWNRYLRYLTLVASFQLWAPLNAVLNMFIDIYSSTSLLGIADQIVSFSTMSQIGNYTDKIVAVASGLQMAIPFLAFNIIQGGVGGFIHLAGTITGASQSAASQAANESVTNNKSFDNYSVGNRQQYNQGGFKTDWNESYASGASSYQHMDGTMEKVTGGGNTLMQSGVGFTASGGATAYKQEDSRHAQVSEGMQVAESMHQQDLRSISSAQSKHLAKSADYIAHVAQREHEGESFAYEKMGEQGESFRQAVNHAKQLHDDRGHDWRQASSASAEIAASGGFSILGNGVTVSGKAGVLAENSSGQSVGESTRISRDNNAEQNKNNIEKAMANSTWAKENSIDMGYSDSVRESYEEVQRAEQQASISKQRVDDWHQAKTVVDSQGASSSRDMYQEVADSVKREYGVDAKTAQKMADTRSPEAQRVWKKLQNDDNYVQNIVANIGHSRVVVSGEAAIQKLDQFTNENSKTINQDPGSNIRQHAANQGMNVDNFKDNIQDAGKNLKEQHKEITAENATQYKAVKDNNEIEESRTRQQVDKYESDRMGQGGASKLAMETLDKVTLGLTGDRIGAPDKDAPRSMIVDKGSYEKATNNKIGKR